ncbi:MAG: UvrD-helicase domain-containing protein [Alphaproteobacteria bacterium]|nr:UvrD-helicase domain-containing protein [Alphaproteobacteria bacterium]
MTNNKLIIAAAGSGKTTFLVEQALASADANILITTYTEANEAEIKAKIFEKKGCIPKHITVQTWFSVLLQHGVRPYQGCLYEPDIKGMILVNGQSGLKYTKKNGSPVFYKEDTEFERHYFSSERKIYSDKIAKFVYRCNEKSGNAVIARLIQIYSHVYIDEVQDLAGYDLEFLKLLFGSKVNVLLVGDPRQGTYSTNNATKYKKFRKSAVVHFFEDIFLDIEKDEQTLTINYRCTPKICELSNALFPNLQKTESGNLKTSEHDGVFLIKHEDVAGYLNKFTPMQLRDSKRTTTAGEYPTMNFGESKGLAFNRVLIYPTDPIKKWLRNRQTELAATSRSKLYVAITRARQSVAFVLDYTDCEVVEGAQKY